MSRGRLVASSVPLPPELVTFEPSWSAVPSVVAARVRPGDVVFTFGAGDVTLIGPEILELLEREPAGHHAMSGARTSTGRRPSPAAPGSPRGGGASARGGCWPVLAVVTGVAAVAGAVWLVGWSDVTALEEVRVDGADGELADQVALVAEAPVGEPADPRRHDAMTGRRVATLPEIWPRCRSTGRGRGRSSCP